MSAQHTKAYGYKSFWWLIDKMTRRAQHIERIVAPEYGCRSRFTRKPKRRKKHHRL